MGNCLIVRLSKLGGKVLKYESPEYHLVPLGTQPTELTKKKKVRFSEDAEVEEGGSMGLRVKLVISKQKLKEMVASGVMSIEGVVSEIVKKEEDGDKDVNCYGDYCKRDRQWKPALKSIPESEYYS